MAEERTDIPKRRNRRMSRFDKPHDFRRAMRGLLAFARPHLPAILLGVVLSMASVAFSVIGPYVLGLVTTQLFEGVSAQVAGTGGIDFAGIGRTILWLIGIYCASSACSAVQGFVMTGVNQRICFRLRNALAAKVATISMGYFEDHQRGDVLSRITNDVDTVGQSLNQVVNQVVSSATQVVGVTVMMFAVSAPLAGITLLTLPASLLIVGVMVGVSQKHFVRQQNILGQVNAIVEEDFTGQLVIQVFDEAENARTRFDEANGELYTAGWKSQFLSGLMQPLMGFVSNMGYVAVVVAGAAFVLGGAVTVGDVQAFMQYVRNFTQPIASLANVSNLMQSMAAAAERIFTFLDGEEEQGPAHPLAPTGPRDSVVFNHVRFGYTPAEPVIHDFSLEVEPGKTVAIVGPTGAGKTTLMKLLLRFWDVNAGQLSVGGVDVRERELHDLRGDFAMVLQDAWLFEGTIRENVRYGRLDATDEEVEEACRIARCDRFIHTLDGGYDFVINEEATNISQGQRQLITIARAVLAARPILILDEATSNVDTMTEELIQEAMDRLRVGRTSFVIAHRLSTIRTADRIIVMNEGDVVETGTHDELLAADGFYATLYKSQFEGMD